MTDAEYKKMIASSENQIATEYEKLRKVAYNVGHVASETAKAEYERARSSATGSVIVSTMIPLFVALVGFFLFTTNWFLALVLIVGGIWVAIKLHEKTSRKRHQIEQEYASMINTVQSRFQELTNLLNNMKKI